MLKNILKKSTIGLIAGFISGFFSTGGGMILVPAFVYLLNMKAQKARGTSIFCILPMVLTSSVFYYQGNYIKWDVALLCAIGRSTRWIHWSKAVKKVTRESIEICIYCIFIICIF